MRSCSAKEVRFDALDARRRGLDERSLVGLTLRRDPCTFSTIRMSDNNNNGTARVFRGWLRRLVLAIAATAAAACVTAPPVQEMSDARQAISAAEQADAARLAPGPLGDARRFLADAERQIQQQAYGPARLSAVRAKNRASQALADSVKASAPDPRR